MAREELNRWFDPATHSLRALKVDPDRHPDLALQMDLLYRLCDEVCERYYKIIKIPDFATTSRTVSYRYQQPVQDRSDGSFLTRALRRGLRAPSGSIYLHIPLARLADHYEFTMSPVSGHYVDRLLATLNPNAKSAMSEQVRAYHEQSHEVRSPWVATENGRVTRPKLFIGDGSRSTQRLYVGVNYEEIPPGAAGHAFSAHLFTLAVATGLVWWSLSHSASTGTSAAGIIAGLLALGSTAIDWLIPRSGLLNAPALPRVLLFTQSLLMAMLSLWILARGSSDIVLEPWPAVRQVAVEITRYELLIGPLIVLILLVQSVTLAIRVTTSTTSYYGLDRKPRRDSRANDGGTSV